MMTATGGPWINQDVFVATQHNKVVAILPDGALDACSSALFRAGVDLSEIDVVEGDEGVRILDFDGTEHGSRGHLVRSQQKLGTASNERENYASALRDGNLVIAVLAHDDEQANAYGKVLDDCGADASSTSPGRVWSACPTDRVVDRASALHPQRASIPDSLRR